MQGVGFMIQGLVFRIQGSGFGVKGAGFRIQGLGRRICPENRTVFEPLLKTVVVFVGHILRLS